jgi:hypothetical protein
VRSRDHPLLYEINTRCWLRQLSERHDRRVTLANVPAEEFAQWVAAGFTDIWLMGVWTTGPLSRAFAKRQKDLRDLCRQFGWSAELDIVGSPYAIADYRVVDELGGDEGLRVFREQLHRHGLRLILDAVLNHVGLDHVWLTVAPQLLMHSEQRRPETFSRQTTGGLRWFAHGKDPHFAAWADTVQLDLRNPKARRACTQILERIAEQCDGVRCDMAMLLLTEVFARTWKDFPGEPFHIDDEFWSEAIAGVRCRHPDFVFIAEVYWNLEETLQQLGFDFTYDKIFYDHIVRREHAALQNHLRRSAAFHRRSIRFLENHDEPRIAGLLSSGEHKAAAALLLAMPGMRLLHDGQTSGFKRKTPVQFGRYLPDAAQPEVAAFYRNLVNCFSATVIGCGAYKFVDALTGDVQNRDIVAIEWSERGRRDVVLVNLSDEPRRCSLPDECGDGVEVLNPLTGEATKQCSGASALSLRLAPHDVRLVRFS